MESRRGQETAGLSGKAPVCRMAAPTSEHFTGPRNHLGKGAGQPAPRRLGLLWGEPRPLSVLALYEVGVRPSAGWLSTLPNRKLIR